MMMIILMTGQIVITITITITIKPFFTAVFSIDIYQTNS